MLSNTQLGHNVMQIVAFNKSLNVCENLIVKSGYSDLFCLLG